MEASLLAKHLLAFFLLLISLTLQNERINPFKDAGKTERRVGRISLDAIRFLADNEVLQVGKDGLVSRKANKKSRQ